MLYLSEYRRRAHRLFDHLPWALLIAPGVVLNKDGAFQRTLEFRGPDLASATDIGLVAACAQLNNALRRLGSRWCLHVEALRAPARAYPAAAFPDPVSHLVDEERRLDFEAEGLHFESRYFLTFTFLPPEAAVGTARSLLVENLPEGRGAGALYRAAFEEFRATVDALRDILAGAMPMVRALDDGETLTYLHACVSTKSHPVAPPPVPMAGFQKSDFSASRKLPSRANIYPDEPSANHPSPPIRRSGLRQRLRTLRWQLNVRPVL